MKDRFIDWLFLKICKLFDLLDKETRKNKMKMKKRIKKINEALADASKFDLLEILYYLNEKLREKIKEEIK